MQLNMFSNTCNGCERHKDDFKPGEIEECKVYVLVHTPQDIPAIEKYLCRSFPRNRKGIKKYVRINSIVQCNDHTNWLNCRQLVYSDIKKYKPRCVIGFGTEVLEWAIGSRGMVRYYGRKIVCRFGNHTTNFFPVYQVLDLIPRDRAIIRLQVANAMRDKTVGVIEDNYYKGVEPLINKCQVKDCLYKMAEEPVVAIDIETTGLKPWLPDVRILSIAISDGDRHIAFAYSDDLKDPVKEFLLNSGEKVCHNLKFELIWFAYFFGEEVIWETDWGDTMALAYMADDRKGTLSLDFLCRQYFGIDLKKVSNLNRSELEKYDIEQVLIYNALDAKYTYMLNKAVSCDDMRFYTILNDTAKSLSQIETKGIHVSLETINKYSKQLEKEQNELLHDMIENNNNIEFNPLSSKQIGEMLKLYKNVELEYTETNQIKTNVDALQRYAENGFDLADKILRYRTITKLRSTYLEGIKKLICDGKVHPDFLHLYTSSARLSSRDPNFQNIPKNKGKYIRQIYISRDGYVIVSIDYSQLEARVASSLSLDEYFISAVKAGLDIHGRVAEWLEKEHSDLRGKRI